METDDSALRATLPRNFGRRLLDEALPRHRSSACGIIPAQTRLCAGHGADRFS
jgi:hypothetical protein